VQLLPGGLQHLLPEWHVVFCEYHRLQQLVPGPPQHCPAQMQYAVSFSLPDGQIESCALSSTDSRPSLHAEIVHSAIVADNRYFVMVEPPSEASSASLIVGC
jgi:hypothetical protein